MTKVEEDLKDVAYKLGKWVGKKRAQNKMPSKIPFESGIPELDTQADAVYRRKGLKAFIQWWESKISELEKMIEPDATPVTAPSTSAASEFASAVAKGDIQGAKKAIGDASKLDNATKTKIRSSIEKSKLPLYYKRVLLKDLGKNVGYWIKEEIFREICNILIENNLTWKAFGINTVFRNTSTHHVALFEYASSGSTSAGNVASVANPGGAMMSMIRRMPAGQSFFAPQDAGTKKAKKKRKK